MPLHGFDVHLCRQGLRPLPLLPKGWGAPLLATRQGSPPPIHKVRDRSASLQSGGPLPCSHMVGDSPPSHKVGEGTPHTRGGPFHKVDEAPPPLPPGGGGSPCHKMGDPLPCHKVRGRGGLLVTRCGRGPPPHCHNLGNLLISTRKGGSQLATKGRGVGWGGGPLFRHLFSRA